MKKALIVAYGFPPVGGAGVQRPVKFIKYLRNHGWSADVVTVLNPSVPVVDESLIRELPKDCNVFRSKTFEPSYAYKTSIKQTDSKHGPSLRSIITGIIKSCAKNLLLPDVQVLWWPHTYPLLKKLLKSGNYSVVLVSGPPFSTFFLVTLASRGTGVPVVIDYRDEWSFSRDNWENSSKTLFARWIDHWMEASVVSHAKAITVASPFYGQTMKERFPSSAERIHTITNGYDPDDFSTIDFFSSPGRIGDSFNLMYTGTVWRATSFQGLLEGMRLLMTEKPDVVSKISLRIIGRVVPEEFFIIEQLQKIIRVEIIGYLPHEKIFKEMVAADCMLLTLADLPGAGKIIPGKVFEYLATPLPILALLPDGVTADLIKNEKNIYLARPNDAQAISTMLQNWLHTTHRSKEFRSGIAIYSRPYLAGKLVELFEHMAK